VAPRRRYDDVPFAWNHPHYAELPANLREILEHAQNFLEVMHGGPLLYNLILAEQARRCETVAEYRRALGEWAKSLSVRSRILTKWNHARFWELVRSVNPRVTPQLMNSSIRGGTLLFEAMPYSYATVRFSAN